MPWRGPKVPPTHRPRGSGGGVRWQVEDARGVWASRCGGGLFASRPAPWPAANGPSSPSVAAPRGEGGRQGFALRLSPSRVRRRRMKRLLPLWGEGVALRG